MRRLHAVAALAALLFVPLAHAASTDKAAVQAVGTDAQASDPHADYGVTLAIAGDAARAESVFVTMLSHTHGDARALNNLGNLRLLRGETGVALAFYDRALRGDSLDAGIHLNRATALMLIGDQDRADRSYRTGVRLAGGVEQAEALMGLPPEPARGRSRGAEDHHRSRADSRHASSRRGRGAE